MAQRPVFCLFLALLVIAVCCSGCTSPQAAPQAPAATPAAVMTTPASTPAPEATVPEKTAAVTKTAAPTPAEKVLLHEKGMISPTQFKKYDFKSLGDQFSQPGEQYRITLKADKPVIGYAVTNYQAEQLGGDSLTPHYVSQSEKVQWGLIEPYLVLGKTDDKSQLFTIEEVAPYVYVVDARWMKFDDNYKETAPFNYELTIAKIIK